MRPASKTATVLFLCSLVSGCGLFDRFSGMEDDPIEVDGPLILTSSDVYEVERTENTLEVDIPLTFHNETGRTVYINRCKSPHPPVLQKHVDGEWATVYSQFVLACFQPPVVIEAGETYDYTFVVTEWLSENSHPKLEVDEVEGTYRLEWRIKTRYEEGEPPFDPLPLEARVSNTFELVEGE